MPSIPDVLAATYAHILEHEQLVPRRGKISPGRDFPVSDTAFTLSTTFLIATLIVQIIVIGVFFARVYTRALPVWKFTADDYIICVAFVLETVAFGLWYHTQLWAWGGHHPPFRTMEAVVHNSMIGAIALPFWGWSTGLVKISIGVMLLRFQQSRKWQAVIWTMIALNVLLILLTGVVNLFQCIPYKAVWDFQMKNKQCWTPKMDRAVLYTSSCCNVLTDVVFSLMPLTFLGKIRRPLREKVVVSGLMALGLVASSFSLSKAVLNGQLRKTKDMTAMVILLGLLSCLEVQTSLIAACIPTLRNSSRRLLQRMGLMSSTRASRTPPYGARNSGTVGSKQSRMTPRELNEINSETSERSGHTSGTEIPEDDAQYEMDPVTGRIICVTRVKDHSSSTNLHDEWARDPAQVMKEEWQARRGEVGLAK